MLNFAWIFYIANNRYTGLVINRIPNISFSYDIAPNYNKHWTIQYQRTYLISERREYVQEAGEDSKGVNQKIRVITVLLKLGNCGT